jgi:hypothetical protein
MRPKALETGARQASDKHTATSAPRQADRDSEPRAPRPLAPTRPPFMVAFLHGPLLHGP